ncbi:tRNA (guanosine(37)-N1)-methyltransferase TrmD [Humibacillus sp. DSM 29435]|uniref:tRNA (guanosine(37)-N1)-methyltransferase TrmD n=1 Tax=Humibacillus sp. DSM 29435 TaxID=1869167 RepID=UPI000872BAE7|nr:tRNA (guanosine(37)-N1)-methyltransferase TrmD [Humibacillus sp. DSM 29435]OFE16658.1 tRNA (guanosine(37)-N1)-methyltransferase TrmD [Humibacillus sp. DSM 29435]
MRVDVVSIFPDYLRPLDLSLIGKARADGLLDLAVHDLRDFTHDRHRTVDDTPYGGGAGMVMKAQPWAEALDAVLAQGDSGSKPHLVVPGPGGMPFTQAMARRLAVQPWLAFACGRYEGIDERVYEHARDELGLEVSVVSLGDYVLNGGEVAVLAMVEAIARLVPGVIGNAASLVEESHEDGLLEYPLYTKPDPWNGRAVPEVLLSGNHAAIATWRHEQRLARTAARRPDLLHPSLGDADVELRAATPGDVPELLTLVRACWVQEAIEGDTLEIPALHESIDVLRASLETTTTWVARRAGRLIGSVRTEQRGDSFYIGRLCVAPDQQGRGLGRHLLAFAESTAPDGIRRFTLNTGAKSGRNLRMYKRAGYRPAAGEPAVPGVADLVKRRR